VNRPELGARAEEKPHTFDSTRWSIIVAAATADSCDENARRAMAELCRTYWRPIFSFICRRGYSTEDAQDLTQDFFVMVLGTDWLQHADRARGRFRSFLLKSLQNFVSKAAEKGRTQKRGGAAKVISWDEWTAEAPSQLATPANVLNSWTPERVFDLRWAATIAENALRKLREECEGRGRVGLFEALSSCLTLERAEMSYAEVAARTGMNEADIKKQLHNLRRRYRSLLHNEVARTVDDPAEIEDEIRHLCAALDAATE
jgi:RNA polymerase sigma-70 factor (ECF subfamily)